MFVYVCVCMCASSNHEIVRTCMKLAAHTLCFRDRKHTHRSCATGLPREHAAHVRDHKQAHSAEQGTDACATHSEGLVAAVFGAT
jgi:hypothetical protein